MGSIDGALLDTISTPGQSESESNNNEKVLHNPQISRTRNSPSDAV